MFLNKCIPPKHIYLCLTQEKIEKYEKTGKFFVPLLETSYPNMYLFFPRKGIEPLSQTQSF